jgi:hypothetical protein
VKNVQFNPYKVGDRIEVSLHSGNVVEAVIKSAFPTTAGWKFNVAIGEDQAATVELWQVVRKIKVS